jgi:hypothetical protein
LNRARAIRIAGIVIILLAAGAALLPTDKGISSDMIGAVLIAGGLVELVAGSLRREVRTLAEAAGAVTRPLRFPILPVRIVMSQQLISTGCRSRK